MEFVRDRSEITRNVRYLRDCLGAGDLDAQFAADRIARGICFVVEHLDGQVVFAPSRFVGYRSNTRASHLSNRTKHGSETTSVLSSLLGGRPVADRTLLREYLRFCDKHRIKAREASFGDVRKFWDTRRSVRRVS